MFCPSSLSKILFAVLVLSLISACSIPADSPTSTLAPSAASQTETSVPPAAPTQTMATDSVGGQPATATPAPLPEATTAAPTPPISVSAFPNPQGYTWNVVAQDLASPVDLAYPDDGSGRLFIVEQQGRIRVLDAGQLITQPFLDIRTRVGSSGNEQGLLGLAFHPDYAQVDTPGHGALFVNYTDRNGTTIISRFTVSAEPNLADPASEIILLRIHQPYSNHNGGDLAFGPDGHLYIALGDGGSGGDPHNYAQNPASLLGKILRIAVDGESTGEPLYDIPTDNPYSAGDSGQPEIWLTGLRNPWKISFDSANGDLYIGDVGQNKWEEINYWPAASPSPDGGANFGWNYFEGYHPFRDDPPPGQDMIPPVWEYGRDLGCSVTGGVVYRGSDPAWQGVYFFGDYCTGRIWGLLKPAGDAPGAWQTQTWHHTLLFETGANITAFGAGPKGELYFLARAGLLYQLAAR